MYRSTGHIADPARHGDIMNRGVWVKAEQSSFDGNCLEAYQGEVQVGIRNSRDPGPRLLLSYLHFRALLAAAKAGELDRP